jgi:hypothetical protein
MRFMVLVKATKRSEAGEMPEPGEFEAMGEFNEQMAKAGILLAADGLRDSSFGTRLQFGNGSGRPAVIDGPFAETKELVAGFWMIQVKSKEEAVEWMSRAPFVKGEEIEIRRVFEMEDFGPELSDDMRDKESQLRNDIGQK